ncbi:MAG: hypothetical protein DI548_08965 [Flavobacterium johnsoniae]|nr:MAG: hypothetical protein DI548_08965 [Flavobacterium johnsoniae]
MVVVEAFDADVRTVVFDFAKDDFAKLPQELSTLDIGILSKISYLFGNFFPIVLVSKFWGMPF